MPEKNTTIVDGMGISGEKLSKQSDLLISSYAVHLWYVTNFMNEYITLKPIILCAKKPPSCKTHSALATSPPS